MSSKLSFRHIIRDHVASLYNNRTKKRSKADLFLLFFVPLLIGAILTFVVPNPIPVRAEFINIVLTALSIFAGLLINVIVLIYDFIKKTREQGEGNTNKNKIKFLREINANISFTILISIFTICFILLSSAVAGDTSSNTSFHKNFYDYFYGIIVYTLVSMFFSHMFMILKRLYNLLELEFES